MPIQDLKRIVVVDDTQSVAFVLKSYLEDEGYDVTAHEDPLEALEDINTYGADLVITDFKMPGMNGLELLAQVEQKHPLTPAIIISADPERINQPLTEYPVIEKTQGFIQKVIDSARKFFNN